MRANIAKVLMALGYVPNGDFIAGDDGQGGATFQWLAAAPPPSNAELEAYTDQQVDNMLQARKDATEPDLAAMKNQATQAVADINTFLAIASPSNAQVLAEVKAIDQRQRAIIKALARLAIKTLG